MRGTAWSAGSRCCCSSRPPSIGWGLVIDTTGAGKGLDWLGFLLEPLGLGGREGEWAYANLGVPVALVIGFVGYLLLGSRAVRRQEHEQVVAGVRAEQSARRNGLNPLGGVALHPGRASG